MFVLSTIIVLSVIYSTNAIIDDETHKKRRRFSLYNLYNLYNPEHRGLSGNCVLLIKQQTLKMFVLSTIIVLSVIYSTNANNSQSDPLVLTDYLSNPELARSKAKIHSIGYANVFVSKSISLSPFLCSYIF